MYYAKNMNWLALERCDTTVGVKRKTRVCVYLKRILEFVIGVLLMSFYYYDIVERGQKYVSIITSRNEID